jgi:alkyl sulfatase BDS1-like metallo-beta-lactamase superfamily hydrolase
MHRIAQLNQNFGLYEVIPGIYQVRGFDLSQATFVRSKSGWILFDVLTTAEPMRAAWELFQQHVGEGLPVKAVVYSHNHGDHWGGVRGVITDEDVSSGRVEVIAPVGFMNNLVAENVYAGNAMNRRLFYQYGILLPVSPYGFVTQGLGPTVSNGTPGLIAPTRIVSEAIEEIEIDGLKLVFQFGCRLAAHCMRVYAACYPILLCVLHAAAGGSAQGQQRWMMAAMTGRKPS